MLGSKRFRFCPLHLRELAKVALRTYKDACDIDRYALGLGPDAP